MDIEQFNQSLIEFLQESPTPFHAVQAMAARLESAGFNRLRESESWQLQKSGRYYVTRNGSSIVAFVVGKAELKTSGIRLVGAHTDSPCLKVKPCPELRKNNYFQLGVEVYGGALLNPWFDRDLSLAGRVTYQNSQQCIEHALVNFKRPVAIIPSLAIHLDREVNQNKSVNPQRDIPPILGQLASNEKKPWIKILHEQLKKENPACDVEEVIEYEIYFYDTQPAALVGINNEFICSARLDNLLSCFAGLQAIINSQDDVTSLLVCNDHEEVGSASAIGAQGPMLRSILERMTLTAEVFNQMIHHSMMISADNAHGIHPNYADKHDANHGPLLNAGPVIKVNANQRYATNSETAALFRQICEAAEVAVQSFVVRTDMACGSTIGPITATELGVKTVDVGVPTFAMHSIRETAGSQDTFALYKVLRSFMNLIAAPCVKD